MPVCSIAPRAAHFNTKEPYPCVVDAIGMNRTTGHKRQSARLANQNVFVAVFFRVPAGEGKNGRSRANATAPGVQAGVWLRSSGDQRHREPEGGRLGKSNQNRLIQLCDPYLFTATPFDVLNGPCVSCYLLPFL